MIKTTQLINQLFSLRNKYGKNIAAQKIQLLNTISKQPGSNKKALHLYYDCLLFLIAYPDNKVVYKLAADSLQQFQLYIRAHKKIKSSLFNSGITSTTICAAFSFEIVKWLKKLHPSDIRFNSFEADKGQIQSILSVVMPKVESEILQDANTSWKPWLQRFMKKGEDILDKLIAVFDETSIRPEVKDELWNAIGINIEIDFSSHCSLPPSLIVPYYHRSLIKKNIKQVPVVKPTRVKLNKSESEQVIECSRMILIRHLREIDPITFTAARLISYYQLARGLSIALMGMVPERRHPIDSYMGYVVFKNGLPIAYAGSWILFDSGRIGLNVFPSYRGGESQYIFEQVLRLHSKVYRLKRFSVDPYQIGKENYDGIRSGAFWVYYHAGFRPILKEQKELAEAEAIKIKSIPGYRSPGAVLKKLASSRMEMVLQKNATVFDATDLSIAYAGILEKKYNNNRKLAEEQNFIRLAQRLQIKNYQEEKMQFILKNWCTLLAGTEKNFLFSSILKKQLKHLFELKATGSEEEFISWLQEAGELRKFLEHILAGK